MCVVYSDTDFEDRHTQGAIVNFNLLRADGQFVGYSEVGTTVNIYFSVSEGKKKTGLCSAK